jgi:homoserine dehydrogenase
MLKLIGAAASALPTIDLINHSLEECEVLKIEGILSATTNYLLDAMMTQGNGFDAALWEAPRGGFAEIDSRSDTDGWDTACKFLILANFDLGAELTMHELGVESIQSVMTGRSEA